MADSAAPAHISLISVLSVTVELVGVAAIVGGFWLVAPWLGLIVGGIALIVVGLALDPPKMAVSTGVSE
ncbi:Uncharacterised protein [Mycobacteroides abscessus subsp. massiliense]|uniref:hypothetical protein n=1 Tax=Mycobacteroides abscessus TaxID=36809 RepID=UPI0009A61923|nr:hypothetical protein [Mycobacteroides abscessus]SKM81158.1 Uncharacterised protein [Mycobacteroides abscessus subsp. massiliense]SKM97601.1 Uncharacterised protein [Mycobacteroides abscessus subsp. massiliense]SKN76552.1 Uncharacterised protein [Mycobacteroides abscessus subsp. massiliense]SKN96658.1 Uncharacterised protein [Mycobacteroides abscessus subsp. massiliense]SKO21139.1 Uncharacterised protein [Mycobacteroides abscessus subsp. massiliense]